MSEDKTQRLKVATIKKVIGRKSMPEKMAAEALNSGDVLKLAEYKINGINVQRIAKAIKKKTVNTLTAPIGNTFIIKPKKINSNRAKRNKTLFVTFPGN